MQEQLVKKIDLAFNFIDIKQEVLEIIKEVGFKSNQIICQSLKETPDDWYTGIGRVDSLEDQREEEYSYINSALKGTKLESLIQQYNCFRTRIMLLPFRQCYSIHADPTPRLHLPIITNSQCWMIWPIHNQCFRMLPGDLYYADTTLTHTFINGSEQDRIHIVFGIKDKIT